MEISDKPVKTRRHPRSFGFTLIELLVVVLLLGIVGYLVVGRYTGLGDHAKIEAAKSDLKDIYKAIMGDEETGFTGFYHETRTDFRVPPLIAYLVSKKALEEVSGTVDLAWDPNHRRGYREGGYLKSQEYGTITINTTPYPTLLDPWDKPYEIHRPIVEGFDPDWESRIVSGGPNGVVDLAPNTRKGDDGYDEKDDLVLYLFR